MNRSPCKEQLPVLDPPWMPRLGGNRSRWEHSGPQEGRVFKPPSLSAPVLFVACLRLLCSKSAMQPYTAVKVVGQRPNWFQMMVLLRTRGPPKLVWRGPLTEYEYEYLVKIFAHLVQAPGWFLRYNNRDLWISHCVLVSMQNFMWMISVPPNKHSEVGFIISILQMGRSYPERLLHGL